MGLLDHKEQLETKVLLVHKAQQVCRVTKVYKGKLFKVLMGYKELVETRVYRVLKVLQDSKEFLELKVILDQLVHREVLGQQEHKDQLALRDQLDQLEQQEQQELRVLPVLLVHKVLPVLLVLRDQLELMVLKV